MYACHFINAFRKGPVTSHIQKTHPDNKTAKVLSRESEIDNEFCAFEAKCFPYVQNTYQHFPEGSKHCSLCITEISTTHTTEHILRFHLKVLDLFKYSLCDASNTYCPGNINKHVAQVHRTNGEGKVISKKDEFTDKIEHLRKQRFHS
jgi:hypothetical protein